jgi:DNA-binding transcriptional MerR regulator
LEKRKSLLKSFLGALGAKEILWGDIRFDKIYGTVIYDLTDPEERQDFVCHMTENNVPTEDVKKLLEYLSKNKLIDIDKIFIPIEKLNIDFIDKSKLENVWHELFNIQVRMIDDGEETDCYFIHD